jgi:HD-GYP domain-containing protein (c-di-GMP phosphodiesterase class II)
MGLAVFLPLVASLFLFFHPSAAPMSNWRVYAVASVTLSSTALAISIFILYRRARASLTGLPMRAVLASTLGRPINLELQPARLDTVAALSVAIEARTRETPGHNLRVASLAVELGREIGLNEARLQVLARAALLHDVGKLGIPEAVLDKPDAMGDLDWTLLRTHPELGSQILNQLGDMEAERIIVAAQQERFEGNGYPHGLSGGQIPIEARVLATVSAYEALLSPRPYRAAHTPTEATTILLEERGHALDPVCVDALLRLLAGVARTAKT